MEIKITSTTLKRIFAITILHIFLVPLFGMEKIGFFENLGERAFSGFIFSLFFTITMEYFGKWPTKKDK